MAFALQERRICQSASTLGFCLAGSFSVSVHLAQVLSSRAVANSVDVLRYSCTQYLFLHALCCVVYGKLVCVCPCFSLYLISRQRDNQKKILILQLVHG